MKKLNLFCLLLFTFAACSAPVQKIPSSSGLQSKNIQESCENDSGPVCARIQGVQRTFASDCLAREEVGVLDILPGNCPGDSPKVSKSQAKSYSVQEIADFSRDWKTYSSQKLGFTLKYPPDWEVEESADSWSLHTREFTSEKMISSDDSTGNETYKEYKFIIYFDNTFSGIKNRSELEEKIPSIVSSCSFSRIGKNGGSSAEYAFEELTLGKNEWLRCFYAPEGIHNDLYLIVNPLNDTGMRFHARLDERKYTIEELQDITQKILGTLQFFNANS